jgi:mycothiol system anti-sigma-R factor
VTSLLETLMPCQEVVALLWEYLDGELNDSTRERMREHLNQCDHCRDHFTFEGAFLRHVARALDEPLDTAGLRKRILAALRDEGHAQTP